MCQDPRHVKCSEMYLNTNGNHSQQKPLQRRYASLVNIDVGTLLKMKTMRKIFQKIYFRPTYPNFSFDNYVIWPGSIVLMNRDPITLHNLLMRARLQDQLGVQG